MSRVVLIACSASKLDHAAPAGELYTGELFRLSKRWYEQRAQHFAGLGILSAKHGLVLPETVLEPYDCHLGALPRVAWRRWSDGVAQALVDRWGAPTIFRVFAGMEYTSGWTSRLPYVENVFSDWARHHAEDGKRTRFGIGHIRKRLRQEVEQADSDLALRAALANEAGEE